MAARRKRATVQRGASIRASRFKAAGIAAHNARLISAVTGRQTPGFGSLSRRRSMGLNEARMNRLRRKVGKTNPRLAARRELSKLSLRGRAGTSAHRMVAMPARLKARPKRMYKRDSRGRFARR